MLKLAPCDFCTERYATLPDGSPYTLGRAPESHGLMIRCARCKRKTRLTASHYNALPAMTMTLLRAHGLEGLVLDDLTGAGLTVQQAEQALEGASLADLHRPQERVDGV